MTRRGKIARLPQPIREQVNRRLENGDEGKQIVEWLNALPKVQAVLAAQFDGQPVNETNLSNWRLGGYQDWLVHQEALDATRQLAEDAADIRRESGGDLAGKLAVVLTARLAVALRHPPAGEEDSEARVEWLRRLCGMLAKIRQGEHDAESQRIKREKLALEAKKFKSVDSIRRLERKRLEREMKPGGPITKEGWKQIEKDLNLL
jgi:hypothetical protein